MHMELILLQWRQKNVMDFLMVIEDEENENFSKNNKTDNIRKLDEYNDLSADQIFNIGKYNLLG